MGVCNSDNNTIRSSHSEACATGTAFDFSLAPSCYSQQNTTGNTLASATPNRKRGKSMSFRSGRSGTVVCKGQMWHGRYYVDIPGEENRRKASVPLGSIHAMKKPEAKRKLRALLEEMGLNED